MANEADGPLRRVAHPAEQNENATDASRDEDVPSVSLPVTASLDDHPQGQASIEGPPLVEVSEIKQTNDMTQKVDCALPTNPTTPDEPPTHPLLNQEQYSPASSTHSETDTLPPCPTQAQSALRPDIMDPRYPHLRKCVIPTYRGRTLREDLSEDTPRYFDDAAVFAGRLVKELETEQSLYHRFSRYGQIVSWLSK
jgi:hypothetical protein